MVLFGNVLVGRQWFGAILVFTGLFADMLFGKKSAKKSVTSTSSSPSLPRTSKSKSPIKDQAHEKLIS